MRRPAWRRAASLPVLLALAHPPRHRGSPAALRELWEFWCWAETGFGHARACCAAGPDAPGCFAGPTATYERCCRDGWRPEARATEEVEEQDEREDRPRPGDDPAAVDRACAGLWIDPAAAAKASAEWERGLDKTLRCRRGGAAWAEWVGDAIRLAAHVPQVDFTVVDLSHCHWGVAECANRSELLRHRSTVVGGARASRARPGMTAALVLHGRGQRKGGRWPPQLLWAPPRRARARRRTPAAEAPSVYVLSIDSLSRSSFPIVMPRTFEFLTGRRGGRPSLAAGQLPRSHAATEFQRFHTLNFGGTLSQVFPMLFGGLRLPCERATAQQVSEGFAHNLYNLTRAVRACGVAANAPSALRRAGYRLATSFTDVGFGSVVRGAAGEWDHVLPYVADAVQAFGPLGHAKALVVEVPRDYICAGHRQLHDMVLEWNEQLLAVHRERGEPLFLYSHLLGAHLKETRAAGLDATVHDHLRRSLAANPDLLVLFLSDHGSTDIACDQRAPVLHVLAPRRQHAEALVANGRAVVSPLDLHATFLRLAGAGGWEELRRGLGKSLAAAPAKAYQEALHLDLASPQLDPRSIFEPLPPERSCAAAGIPRWHCAVRDAGRLGTPVSCLGTETGGVDGEEAELACHILTHAVGPSIIRALNQELEAVRHACAVFTMRRLESFAFSGSSLGGRRWVLRFSVNEGQPPRVFEVGVQLRTRDDGSGLLLSVSVLSWMQVTLYQKYEACTPRGAPAELCVCGESS